MYLCLKSALLDVDIQGLFLLMYALVFEGCVAYPYLCICVIKELVWILEGPIFYGTKQLAHVTLPQHSWNLNASSV